MDKDKEITETTNNNLILPPLETKKPLLDELKPIEVISTKNQEAEGVKIQVVKLQDGKESAAEKPPIIGLQIQQPIIELKKDAATTNILDDAKPGANKVESQIQLLKLPEVQGITAANSVVNLQVQPVLIETKSIEVVKIEDSKIPILKLPDSEAAVAVKPVIIIPEIQLKKNDDDAITTTQSSKPNPSEGESLKTAIPLDESLSALNILEISALIFATLFHSIGILVIAFFFSIYQFCLSIYYFFKWCKEHPFKFKYGYQALKYGYAKEWWTFSGLYRWLTEPPPPPVFVQRTLSGEIKIDAAEAARLEEERMRKMFHQKRFNGEWTVAGFKPPPPAAAKTQKLEFSTKKTK